MLIEVTSTYNSKMIMEENFLFELDQSCKGDVIF
jgi:hypothetical protein